MTRDQVLFAMGRADGIDNLKQDLDKKLQLCEQLYGRFADQIMDELGGDELEAQLLTMLSPYRCCGAPQMCSARCQDDPVSAALALAERELRSAG